ncbi:MAG: hypothetical protein HPY55_09505 [Firmicutes bacterium]|nr:hypothetical protein [Bacillota bacterium]
MDRDCWQDKQQVRFWTFALRGRKLQIWARLVALAALGVLLIVAGPLLAPGGRAKPIEEQNAAAPAATVDGSLAALEREFAREAEWVLGRVAGAGKVVVSVRLRSGPGYLYRDNRNSTQRKTEERDTSGGTRTVTETVESYQAVMARRPQGGEESPVVTGVHRAEVDGVVVVAEGASDSKVKADLFRAVQVMLGVPAHRVTVLTMKAGE